MRSDCCKSSCCLTASAVGLTGLYASATAVCATAVTTRIAITAAKSRNRLQSFAMSSLAIFVSVADGLLSQGRFLTGSRSGLDGLVIGCRPSPGAGTVSALGDAILVDLRDDV